MKAEEYINERLEDRFNHIKWLKRQKVKCQSITEEKELALKIIEAEAGRQELMQMASAMKYDYLPF